MSQENKPEWQKYRDELAGRLKEIRSDDENGREKAKGYLLSEQEGEEYQNAKDTRQRTLAWEKFNKPDALSIGEQNKYFKQILHLNDVSVDELTKLVVAALHDNGKEDEIKEVDVSTVVSAGLESLGNLRDNGIEVNAMNEPYYFNDGYTFISSLKDNIKGYYLYPHANWEEKIAVLYKYFESDLEKVLRMLKLLNKVGLVSRNLYDADASRNGLLVDIFGDISVCGCGDTGCFKNCNLNSCISKRINKKLTTEQESFIEHVQYMFRNLLEIRRENFLKKHSKEIAELAKKRKEKEKKWEEQEKKDNNKEKNKQKQDRIKELRKELEKLEGKK